MSKRVPGPQDMGAEGPPLKHCTNVLQVGSLGLGTRAPLDCPEQTPLEAGGEGGGVGEIGGGVGGRRGGRGREIQPLATCIAINDMKKDSIQFKHFIMMFWGH